MIWLPTHLLLRVVFILVSELLIFSGMISPSFLFLFYLFIPHVQIWCLILTVQASIPGHKISGASAVLTRRSDALIDRCLLNAACLSSGGQ